MDDQALQALNRAWWNERVAAHLTGQFYDIDGFLAGRSTLRPFEVAELGDVSGATLVHLQCHFGLDTLSWARWPRCWLRAAASTWRSSTRSRWCSARKT